VVFGPGRQADAPVEAPKPAAAAASDRPLGGEPAPVVVPPLDESDPVVRELVRKLSSHPRIAAWLATDGLVRNFTAVVANVADGRRFAVLLPSLRPDGPFRIVERDDETSIDIRSYERYSGLAEAVGALDANGTAQVYATLKPRIEEAYKELGGAPAGAAGGRQAASFDRVLERAIVALLQTPIPDEPVALEPRGIGWGFVDDELENLTPAQKQLLRMGPRNARMIQTKLREIALALGIPAERLPR
jgi:hypothetical protein